MTSCLTSRSIASMRSTSNRASRAFQTASAAEAGTIPRSTMASSACASISNQIRYLVSGAQISAISGRE